MTQYEQAGEGTTPVRIFDTYVGTDCANGYVLPLNREEAMRLLELAIDADDEEATAFFEESINDEDMMAERNSK